MLYYDRIGWYTQMGLLKVPNLYSIQLVRFGFLNTISYSDLFFSIAHAIE